MTDFATMPPSRSIWAEHEAAPRTVGAARLPMSTSVVVIGAGVCGLATAAMLVDHGVDVVVIDARESADSVSARSSAKVSVLHELTAANIARMRGEDVAREYIEANVFGFDWIRQRVETASIDCSWEARDAITYITDASTESSLREEADLYRAAGLSVSIDDSLGLPYAVHRAVRVADQAQFHPLAFLDGLIDGLTDSGQDVVTGVRAMGVDRTGSGVVVRTSAGNIAADRAIVATGLPFLDRGGFFARTEPQSSYVVACAVETMPKPGMYLSADGDKRSLRSATTADGTDVLLVGGEGHKTGQGGNTEEHYATLVDWANTHFGVQRVTHRFMAQDYTTPDHIPYAGPLTPGNDRILIATGMNKWGFTNGVAAAAANVARIIDGDRPSWSDAFSSKRLPVSGIGDLAKTNANVAAHMVGGWASALRPSKTPPAGQGHVRIQGVRPVATSTGSGNMATTSVSGVCPHLGAVLTWNPAEETWDCPLHGSRFEADGRLLHGPATDDLESRPNGRATN